jgi:hypothetical protein
MEQDFIGIDVTDSRNHALVHQRRLGAAASIRDQGNEGTSVKGGSQRVDAEVMVTTECFGVIGETDAAQHASADIS